jgi:DNA-binding beta-propeller fold protein YncE
MAVDAGGFIYVTDTLHNLVLKLSPRGETVARWGGTGSQSSRFRMPEGIAVSRAGSIYVADTGNHRVDVLAPSGKVLGSIHEGLEEPEDVLFRDGRGGAGTLYVADGATGRIEKFVSLR